MPRPGPKRKSQSVPKQAELARVGRYEVRGTPPGQPEVVRCIRPADFGQQAEVAAAMAAVWERRGRSSRFLTSNNAYRALRACFRFFASEGITALGAVTPAVLDRFEQHLAQTAPAAAADYADSVWAILAETGPALPDATRRYISHPPAIHRPPSQPTEAFDDAFMKRILRAAKADVIKAERRIQGGGSPQTLWWHETLSFFIFLLYETALSTDVVRSLDFRTDARTRVTDWEAHKGDFVELTYVKFRGGRTDTLLFPTEGRWSAGRLLRLLRELSEPAKRAVQDQAVDFTGAGPWLGLIDKCLQMNGFAPTSVGLPRLIPVHSLKSPLRNWLRHHRLGRPASDPERLTFRALRPTAKALRMNLADGRGLSLDDMVDDHSVEVYARRYTRSERLMHAAAAAFQEISGKAEEFVREFQPTIVDEEGSTDPDMSADEAAAALEGRLDFGMVGCRTPTASPMPGQREGEYCGVAFRACFSCPAAVVTPRHVRRMQRILAHVEEQRLVLSPPEWQALWGPAVAFMQTALERLAPAASQYEQAPGVLLDPGLRGGPTT